eukprot:ANDGO_00911.mRNA.1 ABC transporter A family member 8
MRQKKTNCLQIMFPLLLLIFLLLVSLLSKSLTATTTDDLPYPIPIPGVISKLSRTGSVAPIFPYAIGNSAISSSAVADFLAGFVPNNTFSSFGKGYFPGYPPFQQYQSKADVDKYMYDTFGNGANVASGILIQGLNASQGLTITLYYNGTVEETGGPVAGASLLLDDVPGPLFSSMRSFMKMCGALQNKQLNYVVQYQKLPQKSRDTYFDFVVFVQTIYYTWILHFLMPVFVEAIVFEKEYKLRNMMKMMGLRGHVYWTVQYLFDWILYLLDLAVLIVFGIILQLRFFTMNNPGLYILLFLIWGFTMVGMSLFASTLFRTTRASTIALYFYVLIAGIAAEVTNQMLMSEPDTSTFSLTFPSIIPTFALNRGLRYLSLASADPLPGMTFADANEGDNKMWEIYGLLIGEGVVLYLLFFFIEYWQKIAVYLGIGAYARASKLEKQIAGDAHLKSMAEPADVREERLRVDHMMEYMGRGSMLSADETQMATKADQAASLDSEALSPLSSPMSKSCHAAHATEEEFRGVVIRNMNRRYVTADHEVQAVDNVSMLIPENSLIAMIGHNGAGKTTLISILTGLIPPTSGEASVGGYDIVQEMDHIYSFMGMCPQFDTLWPDQTGREHLLFYGRLKGLKGKPLMQAVDNALKTVNLVDFQHTRSSGYSGGMRRRLSVAIAMIGDPKIIFLDEPTTGLDPHMRREVWDAIQNAKKGRSMILTTHSMEEADALSDRIAIMHHGRLVAIGHSEKLKSSFGAGYRLTVSLDNYVENDPKIRAFVCENWAGAKCVDSLNGTSHFNIPYASVQLPDVFRKFEQVRGTYSIKDWGVSKTTLEEVFSILTSKTHSSSHLFSAPEAQPAVSSPSSAAEP